MKLRTITLTDRAPVVIDEQEWPLIVEVDQLYPSENKPACKPVPARSVKLKVRRHEKDGRAIVYGTSADSSCGAGERRGYYLFTATGEEIAFAAPSPDRVVATIRQVADELGAEGLGQVCIAMLPAERI